MELIKEKIAEVKSLPVAISEIKENFDMGLITLNEYLYQLDHVNQQYKKLIEWFKSEDISLTAMSFIIDNI